MQKSPNLDKPLPLNLFVFHRNIKANPFSDNLEPLRNGPFKTINKSAEVTFELLTQDGETFHTHRNHFIPFYPIEPLIFPHI